MPLSHSNVIFERFLPQIGVTPVTELLSALLGEIAALLKVERVGYFRMEPDYSAIQQEIQFFLTSRKIETSGLVRLHARDYPGYFELVTKPPGVVVSHDVMRDGRLREFHEGYFKPLGITSMLDVPVHRAGQLFGVICHEHVGPAREWTDTEVEAARNFANIVALAVETDHRQRAEAALRESESRYRAVIEHTPAAIVVLDTDTGRFVEVNENATHLFGMSREELLKVGPVELSPSFQPDGRVSSDAASANIRQALDGKVPLFEWTHRHKLGRTFPCEIRVARMPSAAQNLVIGAIMDITDRKRAEAEFQNALQKERDLGELKTNFVNVVSHEFRTPLGVILSATDILENYFDRLRPEQRRDHLQDVRHATSQMSRLMEEVLLLGRVEAGRMECRPLEMNLAEFCSRLVDEQLSATHRKCPIELQLDGVDGAATGDEALLRHIFTNLLSNAVKYSPAGRKVRFSVRRNGYDALFEICDQGIGIPAEDQPRLFEAFHRGRNVGNIPGTGLGLVIVKRCADLHDASLELVSAPGSGTTFVVRLRMFSDLGETAPSVHRPAAKPVSKHHAQNPRH
jgi:PAS domain S-box-containing protein